MNFYTDDTPQSAAVRALRERGLTVFAAESCTGGLVCKLITDVSGASRVLLGGVVSYVNDIKMNILGVSPDTIDTFTEVSEQCAAEMAEGARRISGAHIGLSTTGYASAGTGVPCDMVGVVYVGISDKYGTSVYRLKLDGDRESVRLEAANELLSTLIARIEAY